MSEEKKLPQGRLGRMARLAALGLRSGGSLLREQDGASAAAHAAEALGTLRGLAAKVGQMASYVDGIVPEAQRDAYETSLRVLRSQAPRSSASQVRARVESELGATLERCFARWD